MPKEYIKPIDQGVLQGAIELGILAGYPLVDIKMTLLRRQLSRCRFERNGPFKFAGSIAFKEAARKASPRCCWSR